MAKKTDDLTWWQHCHRWSVQAHLFVASLGLLGLAPVVADWITGHQVLWAAVVPDGWDKWIMVAASLAGVVLRKIKQDGLE